MIKIKRVYDPPTSDDGPGFLVDRLWPRGIKKDTLHIEDWLKEVAPSNALRKWFGHDKSRWDDFCKRYFAELDAHPKAWRSLLEAARAGDVTLLYGARDPEHNNAAALKAYLEGHFASG
jgi:uncharacterized protein YeaO (DUF488 family)